MYRNNSSTEVFDTYNFIFEEIADARVKNWILFGHPFGFLAIVFLYLYLVCIYLPNYMNNRKPYDLKRVIQAYNIFQILACGSIVYGVFQAGWTFNYIFEEMDYTSNTKSVNILNLFWCNFLLKFFDLFETTFFILRKKYSQVTKLHLYHHVSTFFFGWIIVKYLAGGLSTPTLIINNSIHVMMYTYYFLSTLGPKIQQKLLRLKPKLTMMQMIQFWVLASHATIIITGNTILQAKIIGYLFIANLCVNFGMFLNFYMKRYDKTKTS